MANQDYLIGALVADSLALAPHWIYDPAEIQQRFGRVSALLEPEPGSYHHGQPKGGQTHLGHQTLVLAKALDEGASFPAHLRKFWQNSVSYQDKATKAFLKGEAGQSTELAGTARMAGVLAHCADDRRKAAPLLWEQTLVTHKAEVAIAGEGLLDLFYQVKAGQSLEAATSEVFAGSEDLAAALEVGDLGPEEALGKLGRDCSLSSALPSLLYFLLRAKDYRETVIDNVMAGGDSAARGLVLGCLLVAAFGLESVPAQWRTDLKAL